MALWPIYYKHSRASHAVDVLPQGRAGATFICNKLEYAT